ncbi:MAG: 2-C-methyl-D-erythritol 2,4-cyclodiphosphate synthase [bacterium]|nr:2-C-methyl-D-erythritol 2,4-cyclodiphosphate synthase [bacterium]
MLEQLRIGQGFDVHAFSAGRPLVVGGVTIPFELGLAGHSDADVLLHAITDAILGAAALGDIGAHFPDSDPAFKNIDSRILLARAWDSVQGAGFSLVNIDSVIMAEMPKFRPHIDAMREVVAQVLGVDISRVGIKATTTEKLGFVGRREGIAASAVALLVKKTL